MKSGFALVESLNLSRPYLLPFGLSLAIVERFNPSASSYSYSYVDDFTCYKGLR